MVSRKDMDILAILQENARTSIAEISRQVGLSENGIRYRLEKLEKMGYITSYTALLNPRKFGKKVTAVFHLNTIPRSTPSVIARLKDMAELDTIYQTTGNFSIMATGLFEDTEELNAFVTKKLACPGIVDFSFEVVTRKHKEGPFSI